MKHSTILGIDPGAREMGLALLRDREPRYFGVRTLRNGIHPHGVIGRTKQIVLEAVEEHQPRVVAIERPLNLPTRRSHLLNVIADELRSRESEFGLKIVLLAPEEIRRRVTGNPRATRVEVAEYLARSGFDRISTLIARRAAGAALELQSRDEYWLPMFEALALALAARDVSMGSRLSKAVTGSRLSCED